MRILMAAIFAVPILCATAATAQQAPQSPNPPDRPNMPGADNLPNNPHPPNPPNPDPLAHLMFPPDMNMNHARQLNLTDDQKAFMRSEIQKTTASFQDLQWKLQ